MYTIAIVNEKGGTCKTTTSVNLAAALGALGHKVLLVDLDGQAASSRWLGVEDDTSFAEALYSGKDLKPLKDVMPNVSLAPASGKLDAVAHDLRPTQGGQLRKLLREVESDYEYCIIDCPPSLGNRLIGNALLAASHAIVPVETSILALDGLKILLTTLDDVREGFGHTIALAGVLACRFDARTRLSHLVLAELKRALPGKVFDTVIRENVRMRECPASSKSILDYATDSHAAEDYRALASELVNSNRLAPASEADYMSDRAAIQAAEETMRLGDSLRMSVGNSYNQQAGNSDLAEPAEPVQLPPPTLPEGDNAPFLPTLPSLAQPVAVDDAVTLSQPAGSENSAAAPVPAEEIAELPADILSPAIQPVYSERSLAQPAVDLGADIAVDAAIPNPEPAEEIVASPPAQPQAQSSDAQPAQEHEPLAMPQPESMDDPIPSADTQTADADCPNLRRLLETIDWNKVEPHSEHPADQPGKRGLLRRFLGK
jgi:chromosome partitioning protein